eukprot:6727427-Pyramimonas_sp.AAC.1
MPRNPTSPDARACRRACHWAGRRAGPYLDGCLLTLPRLSSLELPRVGLEAVLPLGWSPRTFHDLIAKGQSRETTDL